MRRVLIYGGKGALGAKCVAHFKSKADWVASVDLSVNEHADANIVITSSNSWTEQGAQVLKGLDESLGSNKLDGIFCVAGGWAGGNARSEDLFKNSDAMWKQSVWSSVIASQIAARYLRPGGILQLTGAQAALTGTPGMVGYGLAKAAVHQLVRSLASDGSGLPADCKCLAILPVTLDTPMNRKFMSNADFSSWTSLDTVTGLFDDWLSDKNTFPSGSLVQLITADSKTSFVPVSNA